MEKQKVDKGNGKGVLISGVTGKGAGLIAFEEPYMVEVKVQGIAPILSHRWDCDSVKIKDEAKKGSKAKKEDDIESYLYRTPEGYVAVSARWVIGALVNAARSLRDPRSPRKNGQDLVRAAIHPPAGVEVYPFLPKRKSYDYLDRQMERVQRQGITRVRPAFLVGWEAAVQVECLCPELLDAPTLGQLFMLSGRVCGWGDKHPTYGRFMVTQYKQVE